MHGVVFTQRAIEDVWVVGDPRVQKSQQAQIFVDVGNGIGA